MMGWGEESRPRITGDDFQEALKAAVRAGKVRIVERRDYVRADGAKMAELDLEIVDE
jgi:hypothetical protein